MFSVLQPDPFDSDFSDENGESTYQEIGPVGGGSGYPMGQLPLPPLSATDDTVSVSSRTAAPMKRAPKMFSKSGDSYILGTTTVTVPVDERVFIYQTDIGYTWNQVDNLYTVSIASPKNESKFGGLKTFTAYQLTPSITNIVVSRRYKQFDWLHERLTNKFCLIPIPPLPGKQQTGRFDEEFIEHRRAQLQEFINYMCGHPILSQCEVWKHFISCTDEKRWKAGKRRAEKDPLVGASYCAAVNAPEKQLLHSQVEGQIESCSQFANQMSGAIKLIMSVSDDQIKKFQNSHKKDQQRIGEGFSELAKALEIDERRLTTNTVLSNAVGRTAAIFIGIGKLFGEQPKRDWLPFSDKFHIYRGILASYPDVLAEHRNAMQKRKECEHLTAEQKMGNGQMQEVNRRTDVMSYAVMAEMNQFRLDRDQNLKRVMYEFITAQIDFYRTIVDKLEEARGYFK